MSVNRVVLVGRLVKDPDIRNTSGGTMVANMYMAVDRIYRREEQEADFFAVATFGKSAEFASKYLSKGRLIAVDGRLQQRRYTTQDGQERNVVEVIADNIQGLDRPRDGGGGGGDQSYESKDSASSEEGQETAAVGSAQTEASDDEYDPFAPE